MTHLVLISGSMAAGKSTIAELLTRRLRTAGHDVALVALDDVADMARPTLPDWDWAHSIHARLVGMWVATGIEIVVDEGTSSLDEVRAVEAALPPGTAITRVVVTTDYDRALARAQADPTRGLSKDPHFLRSQHEHFATQLPLLERDLLLEVQNQGPGELVDEVMELVLPALRRRTRRPTPAAVQMVRAEARATHQAL